MGSADAEQERLAFVRSLQIVDTPIEERFERITRLLGRVLNAPIAAISIVDGSREWFKSIRGCGLTEMPLHCSFAALVILKDKSLIINDVNQDPRFADNPLVSANPPVCFFAGFPISIAGDVRVGAVSIFDYRPRSLSPDDLQSLEDFSDTVASEIKSRLMRNVYGLDDRES